MGHKVTTYYVKTEVEAPGGETQTLFLQGMSCDLDGGASRNTGAGEGSAHRMTPEQMEAYAEGLEMTGSAMSDVIGDGLEDAGMPRNLFKSMGGDPWVSPDPATMMGGMGEFMRDSAEGQREMARERQADAEQSAEAVVAFRDKATLVGTETVDGREAYHLRVEDLDQVEKLENGQELALNTVSIWIDRKQYVTLKTRTDGVMTERGEQRPVVMEQSSTDFRTVPGSDMYEPYRQTVTMSGMLSEEDKAQMAEAKEQLAEAEREMASMSPDQRAMVEQMMGGQMDMLRNMANSGGFTMETVVDEIVVNPDPGAMVNSAVTSNAASAPADDTAALEKARRECLEQKIAAAEAAKKKKKGFGKFLGSVARTTARYATGDFASEVATVSREVYKADATAKDMADAAEALGLSEDDIAECRNPAQAN